MAVLSCSIRGCLARFDAPAPTLLQDRLAPLGEERVNKALHLPVVDPVDLFDPARYVEQDSKTNRAPKLQHAPGYCLIPFVRQSEGTASPLHTLG